MRTTLHPEWKHGNSVVQKETPKSNARPCIAYTSFNLPMLSRLRSCLLSNSSSGRKKSEKGPANEDGPWFTLGSHDRENDASENEVASLSGECNPGRRCEGEASEGNARSSPELQLSPSTSSLNVFDSALGYSEPNTFPGADPESEWTQRSWETEPVAYSDPSYSDPAYGDAAWRDTEWSHSEEGESSIWKSSPRGLLLENEFEEDVFATSSPASKDCKADRLDPTSLTYQSPSRTSNANFDWQQAIATLFAEIRPEIKRLIARHLDRRLMRRVDPSDVAQNAFIDAQEKLTRFLHERPMEVHRWLFFLAKMKTLETNQHHLNTRKRSVRMEADLSGSPASNGLSPYCTATSPSQVLSRKETREQLKWAISQLPDHYQQVIELRHMRGLSNAETSQILELTENATSKLYSRALNALQKELRGLSF